MKWLFLAALFCLLVSCGLTPEQLDTVIGSLEKVSETSGEMSPYLPSLASWIALAVSLATGGAAGILHGKGKEKSFNKGHALPVPPL